MKIVITGDGIGEHKFPGIAISNKLKIIMSDNGRFS